MFRKSMSDDKYQAYWQAQFKRGLVVLSRFELLSPAPKAGMIDHYTTGLSDVHYASNTYFLSMIGPMIL